MPFRRLLPLTMCLLVCASRSITWAEEPAPDPRHDFHSFANSHQIRVRHVALDLKVDFDQKQLVGSATLAIERMPGCPQDAPLILDTRSLTIERVTAGPSPTELAAAPFQVGAMDRFRGEPLMIKLPPTAKLVKVEYRTSPHAWALQWLDRAQTTSGKHPFLFSQSEAIHARSWIPLQDSPALRVTYEARIQHPPALMALMSAERVSSEAGISSFRMTRSIPSYLIALAVGELAFRPLSERTGVFAEPALVQAAASEFAETEPMVQAAERLVGPYRWGRYDLLVLPPSFPYGGMENPMLTFATPTVIAGDKSLVALVAHELAHSWSGNLVTNATWRDFWLNEGFTTYLERRIVEALYGPDRAAMEAVLGLQELRAELGLLPAKDQILHIDLKDRDPDEGMTRVPYEKGALFLATLEQRFGRQKFDAFMRNYFDHFAFQSITTPDFEKYLRENLLDTDPAAAANLDVTAWLEKPGLPDGYPEPHSARFEAIDRLITDWQSGKIATKELPAANWSTLEWLHFLKALAAPQPASKLAELDNAFKLSARGNAEIKAQWLVMSIQAGYQPAQKEIEPFLLRIGRLKFLRPIYEALAQTPEGKARAQAIFARARPHYHPISAEAISRILGKP